MKPLGLPTKGPEAVVCVKTNDGTIHDLSFAPTEDTEVTTVIAASDEGRAVIRHSCTHVMAQAVQAEFPGTKLGIGPAIADGFYYDFGTDHA
ncbi:MAG: threonine--tRNA ligase, partial [Corynebacterium sp.]|nr:threonine--tRNA ligase [Corynebacterium sp.]